MKLSRKLELESIVLVLLLLFVLYVVFFWGYYFIRPSHKGEKILTKLGIPYPAVIAHRGASYKAPESTEPAYMEAHRAGAAYVEADIRRTKDGALVIVHDRTLERTSNVAEVFPEREKDPIDSFTHKELLQLDFGSWFNKKYPMRAKKEFEGLKILTLEELLEITERGENRTGVVLDLKLDERHAGIEDDIISVLKGHDRPAKSDEGFSDVVVFSFYLNILKSFKEKSPEIPRVLLIDDNRIGRRRWSSWLEYAEDHVNGFGIKGFVSWPWHIAEAHTRDLFVFPYAIKTLWQLRILSFIQSSGYITNRPEMVQRFLNIVPVSHEQSDEENGGDEEMTKAREHGERGKSVR